MAQAKEQKKAAASDKQPTKFVFNPGDFPALPKRDESISRAGSYTAVHEGLGKKSNRIRAGFVLVEEDQVPKVSHQVGSHEPVISITIASTEKPEADEDEFLLVDLSASKLSSSPRS